MVAKWGPDLEDATPPLAAPKRSKNAAATQPRFFIDFGRHFGDILTGLAPKIKHLASHGRTKTRQKRIRDATSIFQ